MDALGRSSMRRAWVSADRAALEAAIGPKKGGGTRAETAPRLTIRPSPAARSAGRKALIAAVWPITLISNCRRQASAGTSSTGPCPMMPALLTRASRRGPTASAAAARDSSSVRSRRTGVSPASRRGAASAGLRWAAYTIQPSAVSLRATAPPTPPVAPVTRTVRGGVSSATRAAFQREVQLGAGCPSHPPSGRVPVEECRIYWWHRHQYRRTYRDRTITAARPSPPSCAPAVSAPTPPRPGCHPEAAAVPLGCAVKRSRCSPA